MCNLCPKEGSSLFAVLAKRQRKTLPKSLHLHAKLCISFWPLGWQFRKHPRGVDQKCVKGKKHTALQVELATWWEDPLAVRAELSVTCETPHHRVSALRSSRPAVPPRVHRPQSAWCAFHSRSRPILTTYSPQGKMTVCCPRGWTPLALGRNERHWIKEGGGWECEGSS